jgi:hypothetical protein
MSLLPNPQSIQLGLEGAPVNYVRSSKCIFHEVCPRFLGLRLGRFIMILRKVVEIAALQISDDLDTLPKQAYRSSVKKGSAARKEI